MIEILKRILLPGGLRARFQPVYELSGASRACHYFEALIRGPRGSTVESPDILFDYARQKGQEAAVDRACARVILRAARGLPEDVRVGINVHASTLASDPKFSLLLSDAAAESGIRLGRIVIELVEHARPWGAMSFQKALSGLRSDGVGIALDDVGMGESNFKMILDARPDYFKIDRYFVHGAQEDRYRQAVLDVVAELARRFDARVVAEGVETAADLEAVRQAGISLGQGYLFGGILEEDPASGALGEAGPSEWQEA